MSALKYFILGAITGVVGIGAAALISEKVSGDGLSYVNDS